MSARYVRNERIEVTCWPRNEHGGRGDDLHLEFSIDDALCLHTELRDALIDAGVVIGLKSTDEERVGG